MWLIKSEEETNEKFGCKPNERNLHDFINNSIVIVDKHRGPTSHQISLWISQIFGIKKVGHSGTLDPNVTGVLPVAIGNATKSMIALQNLPKEYVGIMHLHKEVSEDFLRNVVKRFVGKIKQLPPKKSAVARRIREREVYYFDILEIENKDVLFKVGTEAGTYIRKLCHDIGEALGVGAHMKELRRTKVGNWDESIAHSLVEIRDAFEIAKKGDERLIRRILIPVDYALAFLKKVFVKDSSINPICHGSPLFVSGITRIQKNILRGDLIGIYSLKEELIALGIAKMDSEEMFKRKKGVAVRVDRVFMKPDTYPKIF